MPKYKRILLKISGEYLAGDAGHGINFDIVKDVCQPIKRCVEAGVQVALVVGGGNFWRGRSSGKMERSRADHMGMLATVINGLGIVDTLEQEGVPAVVLSALEMPEVADLFVRDKAVELLEQGKVVILTAGTGCPFFSTDSGAALRAAELNADIIFKATMVDGVYDSDPKKNPNAKKFDTISFDKVLEMGLGVMDATAAALCRESHIPMMVFCMDDPENIYRAAMGENIGTVVEI